MALLVLSSCAPLRPTEVVTDRGATLVWDGRHLPGVWLTAQALETALARVGEHGVVSVAIRRSHHIGCLAVYLARAVEQGCMMLLTDRLGDLSGLEAVVIGRSNIVGKPMAQLLLDANATVTIAHSRTKDLPAVCRDEQSGRISGRAVGMPQVVQTAGRR